MPDTHPRMYNRHKRKGEYEGILSVKNKKSPVGFPLNLQDLVHKWNEETAGFNSQSRVLCKGVCAVVPNQGLGHGDYQNAPELVEHIACINQDLERLLNINVVEALDHDWQPGASINHAGLVVHHEMEVHHKDKPPPAKPWISTFYLAFKEDGCMEDCCPTAAKWTDVVHRKDKHHPHSDMIKKWLVG